MPGKKFPDLTGDGKVTKKDILKARGVPGFQKGGMMRKGQKGSDAENLKNIETQQQRQSERAKEAEKAVKGYAREKARVRGTGSAISGKNFKGVF
jgi:hypothetical protein